MFLINDDMSIYVTRGDAVFFEVGAEENGEAYIFRAGDVLRFKVFSKKNCEDVVLQKDFPVEEDTTTVNIILTKQDTKIREVISKPTDYWYEVELNPFTNPQTIIGYDDEGAKVFRLYPEGDDFEESDPIEPEDVPVVDEELDLTSTRPVQNQAIARAVHVLNGRIDNIKGQIVEATNELLEKGGIFATMTYDEDTEELNLELLEFAVAEDMVVQAVNDYFVANPVEVDVLIRVYNGYIQYSMGDDVWRDIIAMSELKGEKGDPFTYEDFTEEQLQDLKQAEVTKGSIEKALGYLPVNPSDLDEYVKDTDIATNTKAGLVKVGSDSAGVKLNADGLLIVASAGVSEINAMASANRPITPYYLKYAIKTGLTKNDLEWTEEEKASARNLLGIGAMSSARIGEVTLSASKWTGTGHLFSQVVTLNGATENTQVDLTPSVEQLSIFYEKDISFVTENEGGVVTVYAIGQKPQNDYTIQVTMTEVAYE